MLRAYLLIVVAIGVAVGLMRHEPSRRQVEAPQVHMIDTRAVDTATVAARDPLPIAASLQDGTIQLPRNQNGHFYADVEINGSQVHMLVDTGATGIALSREDARKAGIATSIGMNDVVGQGADGNIHGEYVMIDRIALGETSAEQMPAMVLNSGEQSLLGQQFLQKFSAVEIHGDAMTLR